MASIDSSSLPNGLPIHRVEIPALGISASYLRSRVARGAPIQYLVPDGVARYIHEQGLYRDPGPDTQ